MTNSPKGWDFVVQWVLHIVKTKRSRRKRHKKRTNNNIHDNSNHYDIEDTIGESSFESRSNYQPGDDFIYAEEIVTLSERKSRDACKVLSDINGENRVHYNCATGSSFATVV